MLGKEIVIFDYKEKELSLYLAFPIQMILILQSHWTVETRPLYKHPS